MHEMDFLKKISLPLPKCTNNPFHQKLLWKKMIEKDSKQNIVNIKSNTKRSIAL